MENSQGFTSLGVANYRSTNQLFGIKDKDRLGHIYVIGKTGVGKSTLLENMAISDIERGNGLCIVDPHGDIATDILDYIPGHRRDDLIYFNATDQAHPLAFNPLKGIHPNHHHLVASGLVGTFKKIWSESWGPRMEYILRFTLLTLLCVPDATLLDIQPLLTDEEYRERAFSYVKEDHILSFWENEFEKYSPRLRAEAIAPILNKTGLFLTSRPLRNIVGQKTSSFRLQHVLNTGKILIVNLSIQISKLRFFIALLVDQKPDLNASNRGLRPLPNLDFKLVCANTLVYAPDSKKGKDSKAPTIAFADPFQDEFSAMTAKYFSASFPAEKKKLRDEIEKLVNAKAKEKEEEGRKMATHFDERYSEVVAAKNKPAIDKSSRDARLWASYPNLFKHEAVGFFQNQYFFPEVCEGFHVVIGNPPYVQLQKVEAAMKAELEAEAISKHYVTYTRSGDLYQLFYERGADLLRKGAHLCYITSNKWMRAKYGESTRRWFGTNTKTLALIDFGMAQVFESATTYTNVILFQNANAISTVPMCRIKSGDFLEGASLAVYASAHSALIENPREESWIAYRPEEYELIKRIEKSGKLLREWDVRINYGIKTGYNEAFIIPTEVRDRIIEEDPGCDEVIRPILRGEDIKPYVPEWAGEWLINTHNGVREFDIPAVNVKRDYPALYRWFNETKERREKLEIRSDKGDHWSNLRSCAYVLDFAQPKIIYPNMTKFLPFCYDEDGYMTNQKCFIMTGEHLKYLTVVLNSSLWKFAFKDRFPELLGDTFELSKVFFEKIPVMRPPNNAIEQLFNGLLDAIQAAAVDNNPAAVLLFTRLADASVYELYFSDEIRKAGAGIMEHLNVFTGPGWSNKQERGILVLDAYLQLSDSKHPAAMAMFKLSVQPEVQLIESSLRG